jgi:outer membrane scaffolding protein for murein synthesis (MipA/OmpV family)
VYNSRRADRRACALRVLACLFLLLAPCEPVRADPLAPKSDWDATLGGGIVYKPRYDGARHYQPIFVPNIDVTWRDTLFLSTEDGLGWNALRQGGFSAGPFLYWDQGRDQNEESRLNGLGDVDDTLQAGIFAEYESPSGWRLFSKIRRDVLGSRSGLSWDTGGEVTLPLRDTLFLQLRVQATWADAAALEPFFGITAIQSSRSGFPVYSPGDGFRDVTFEPSLTQLLDEHWSITGRATASRLLPEAANSPIVRNGGSAEQFTFGLFLNYHF